MSEKKIIDLAHYQKKNRKTRQDSNPPSKGDRPFEKKLQELIHGPFQDPGARNELISIFEEEQLRKDRKEEKE